MNKVSSAIDTWKAIQETIKEKLGTTTYETWFSSIVAKPKAANALTLEMPDEFFKNWVFEHYLESIQDILKNRHPQPVQIELVVNPKILEETTKSKLKNFEAGFKNQPQQSLSLNPRFTFESFVVGPSNRFAHAASLAIVESPAKAYNPFFIWIQSSHL